MHALVEMRGRLAQMRALARMFTEYNRWANTHVLTECSSLPLGELRRDFGGTGTSIAAVLNSALAADQDWLTVLSVSAAPAPNTTDADWTLDAFVTERSNADEQFLTFTESVTERQLALGLRQFLKNDAVDTNTPLGLALVHLFQQQSHYRSQVLWLLSHLGRTTGDLGFMAFQRATGLGLSAASQRA
jgi:uncharacterized damage-inducible protein DinB